MQAVVDRAPIGQIFSHLDGVVASVNATMAAMLGYVPHEMVGRHTSTFMSNEAFDEVRIQARELVDNPFGVKSTVRRFLHRDGFEILVSVTSALLSDAHGVPDQWVSLVLDLTEEERQRAASMSATAAARAAELRLGLQHAVAVASTGAASLVELAPTVLRLVGEHFGWAAGGLVTWSDADATTGGSVDFEFGFGDCAQLKIDTVGRHRSTEVFVETGSGYSPTVVVPLGGTSSSQRRALVFDASTGVPGSEPLETLRTIGLQAGQVVERAATAMRLRDSELRFRSVFDSSPMPMAITLGESGTFGIVNNSFCDLVGRRPEDLLGRSAAAVLHPDDLANADPAGAAAAAAPDRSHTVLMRFVHASGDIIYSNTTLTWIDDAHGQSNLLAQYEDITARRAAEEAVRWQASHDMLTGLFNRSRATDDLREMADGLACAVVMYIDIDAFKLINDTRGHDAGDEVLIGVAQRLRELLRPVDIVARFGGDEFVVICPFEGSNSIDVALVVADRIGEVLATPFRTTDGSVRVTASVGVAAGQVDAREPQRLIRQADAAMNHAKNLGRARRVFYDEELHHKALERVRTEAALRTALDDGRFVLHLQPIVRLDDCSIVGFESLVRLIDEDGSLVPPGDFIAVAEQSGLIVPMGTWVIQQSCRIIAELRELTGRPLTISVNVAARQAARSDLGAIVIDAIRASGLPDDALTLELTESALLEAHEQTLSQLTMLRELGVGIALDDFGTGYSSLTYLRRLPVTCLKIDRSFVQDMMATESDRAIVRAVANLANDLGLQCIVEGVESVEQRHALCDLGAGLGQGYLFSRPVPYEQLVELLAVHA